MNKKEVLSLSAGIGFFIIWVIDLNAPTPVEIQGKFWLELFFHYNWLMFCMACLFYYQISRNERLKSEADSSQKKPPVSDKTKKKNLKK
ncbi:hypothetical protein V7S79_06760 [Aquirufa sp. ROCK-SH2]